MHGVDEVDDFAQYPVCMILRRTYHGNAQQGTLPLVLKIHLCDRHVEIYF